ncbi:hypothetical protein ARMGADRAFT_1006532 [Armillaria gallica]|uniref:Uncharacterized protein n=1 Tax=Armillaria gallica TaxID=47427 RepID=A0A2H3EJP8_ARMGA|nr:hypothetical protein ARMGADRAFT_1006532 [Armillaria gallica]
MAFEACLCTAISPHHLVLSSSTVARLPRYDEGGRVARLPRYDHPILLALSFRPSASGLGLITAPLCKRHVR